MRILVGILAYQLSSEVLRRVHTQEWGDPDGYDVICRWGADMRPDEDRFQAITRKYQSLQRLFLAGPWDALLCVESDMLIPPNALSRLSRLVLDGADVAYGLYCWRYPEQMWWSAHPRLRIQTNEPHFWSLTHQPEEARRLWGKPVVVEGLGLGCTLLPRHTLARLEFRQRAPDHSCDTALALDCQDEGLTQIADLGVVCGHKVDGRRVVWPDPEAPELYRIEEGL